MKAFCKIPLIFSIMTFSCILAQQNAVSASRVEQKLEAYDKYVLRDKETRSIISSIAFVCIKKGEEYVSEGNTNFPEGDIAFNMAGQCIIEAEKMLESPLTRNMTQKNLAPRVEELMGNPLMREYIMCCALGAIGAGFTSYSRDHAFMQYAMRIETAAGIMGAVKQSWLDLP